ncbi:MAG: glucosaminidase domain-containing protein [Bacteroidales bacterium]|nr:glucosaminidase domain-containing protein [Bacteroidales bacterium]
MRNKLFYVLQLALISCMFSCKVSKPVVSKTAVSVPRSGIPAEDYISTYKDIAVNEMKRTGIPASITLAQGMIESDCGRSSLAREANNHFGIKCHNGWTGPTITHDDDKKNDCFRKYPKVEDSFYDHSDFLKSGSRYGFLFNIDHTNYKEWAYGLKKAGYATNPDYAKMLIRNIEENHLWYYDKEYKADNKTKQKTYVIKESVPSPDTDNIRIIKQKTTVQKESFPVKDNDNIKPVTFKNDNVAVAAKVQRVKENNGIQYIIVKDGDTKEKLENEFQLLKWELLKFNELKDDFKLVPGQILYLQPKREKAEPGKEYHNVAEGETMYLISQLYGVKLKKLYEFNRMENGTEPEAGKKIWLRNMKPVNGQG